MGRAEQLITENLELWSSAVKAKSSAGRGSSKKRELYGISKLRDLILDLAVRGMLVQQDLNDEPASKYLERTAAAKIKLLKDKKIKKQRPLAKIETDSLELRLPRGWQWERLGNLVEMYNGRAFKSTEWRTEGLPIVRIQNLNDNKADFNYFQGELSDSNRISNGSFLISWSGTPGTSFGAFIWERGPAALNQHINKCEFHSNEVNLDFMRLAVNGQMNHFISKAQGGVGLKHVTKGTLNNAILGIPPLAEQHRIVAKVDELMALCDQLEQEQDNNLKTHETLVSTLLNALTSAAADASQFADAWQRIKENFDILFTTESSVDQLKQTILHLAVMGKLVEHDPGNRSASDEFKSLIKKRDSSDLKLTKIDHSAKASDIQVPGHWMKVKLGEVVSIRTGFAFKSADYSSKGTFILRVTNIDPEGTFDTSDAVYLPDSKLNKKMLGFLLQPNELLVVMVGGSLGKIGLVTESILPSLLNQNMWRLLPYSESYNHNFLHLVLRDLNENRLQVTSSTHGHLAMGTYAASWVPLPPLAEQHRIVSKVDELMGLCDQLKARLAESQATQLNLADSLVDQAIHSPA